MVGIVGLLMTQLPISGAFQLVFTVGCLEWPTTYVFRAVRARRRPCCESCGAPAIPVHPSGTGQKAPVLRVLRGAVAA